MGPVRVAFGLNNRDFRAPVEGLFEALVPKIDLPIGHNSPPLRRSLLGDLVRASPESDVVAQFGSVTAGPKVVSLTA
jgi:hypothetical protein